MNTRNKEALKLMKIIETALYNYNLETCLNTKELPLDDEITLDSVGKDGDNFKAIAVTKFCAINFKGNKLKFLAMDKDDIFTLQDIVSDLYL